jgi:hypothetical protein
VLSIEEEADTDLPGVDHCTTFANSR